MSRANPAFLAFNRGLMSPKALARVDLDRTKLSAETFTNWLPKTQGAMRIRPGTKYLGSSINDTGAQWIEFVAATDDAALLELTDQKMRVWVDDALLVRPHVATTLSVSDTGWVNASTGGALETPAVDAIPQMTAATTSGVTISTSSENSLESGTGVVRAGWKVGDNNNASYWQDTGNGGTRIPSWVRVDFGAGNEKNITTYTLRAGPDAGDIDNAPSAWQFQRSSDGSSWTSEDTQGSETWAAGEERSYSTGGDTGTTAFRYWRLNVTALNGDTEVRLAELKLIPKSSTSQVQLQGGVRVFNATSIGSLAKAQKRVVVDTGDLDVEHSLAITITRGPIILRCGSSAGDDDYISETSLGTGYHNLAFTPAGDFHVTLQSDDIVDRIVSSISIGDTGTVEVTTFLDASVLDNVRYDQSADVVYLDAQGSDPHKIERRGTGRSWSFVKLAPVNGPFLPAASSSAKLRINKKYGNATLRSDIPFFTDEHAESPGALVRMFHGGQSGLWPLGALNAQTDAIEMTGIGDTGDTGTPSDQSERRITFSVTGTYTGGITIERSFDGPDSGFHKGDDEFIQGGDADDTGTFSRVINDKDDNSTVWYRGRMTSWTSGTALVSMTYPGGGVYGTARITNFNSNQSVSAEILSRFSDTGVTDIWQEGSWSQAVSPPSAVALHSGRLAHAGGANLYMSVSDDYENFDDLTEGDAGPIVRTFGSGPVDSVYYLISLLRLIAGTSGAEISIRSSSLDEPLTPSNNGARAFSTQGSANIRALKMDTRAIFVQRSTQRAFLIGFGQGGDPIGDYEVSELTMLVPDLLEAGVVSVAIQRQPDTRIHFVLANGKVAILTYEPQEEVICWSMWETDGVVEKAAVLPGTNEDKVYYHINRTINGATKRYLERWALESESIGDTGLSWLSDCAKSVSDTGRLSTLTGFSHLEGESVVVWSDDTGQPTAGRDLSPDVAGVQTTYAVTGGSIALTDSGHHFVAGLPYTADWKSTKLAYAAQAGTALAQMKTTDKIGFVLYQTHRNGLFFGNDTGHLDALPRVLDNGAVVDNDKIFESLDAAAMPFPGLWNTDSRIHLRAKSPRPAMVLAAVPTVATSEKV
jgi:hypothetical protein